MANIIHPGLLAALGDFYPSTCTIQESTESQNTAGEITLVWANFAGHVALACRIAPTRGREVKDVELTWTVGAYTIGLAGYYPTITPKMRAVVGGETYDILTVESDGQSEATWLGVQVVE